MPLAASERRRPSSIHPGISSWSAPALMSSSATCRCLGSSEAPSEKPIARPATWASRSVRPHGQVDACHYQGGLPTCCVALTTPRTAISSGPTIAMVSVAAGLRNNFSAAAAAAAATTSARTAKPISSRPYLSKRCRHVSFRNSNWSVFGSPFCCFCNSVYVDAATSPFVRPVSGRTHKIFPRCVPRAQTMTALPLKSLAAFDSGFTRRTDSSVLLASDSIEIVIAASGSIGLSTATTGPSTLGPAPG